MVRPRFGEEVFVDGSGQIERQRHRRHHGGWVHITVDGGGARRDRAGPVRRSASTRAGVRSRTGAPEAEAGAADLRRAGLRAPALCAESDAFDLAARRSRSRRRRPKAPVILSPTRSDPQPGRRRRRVHRRRPGDVGHGARRRPGRRSAPPSLPTASAPTPTARSRADHAEPDGAGDPNKGWHKLVFDQGGAASPRCSSASASSRRPSSSRATGAELDCKRAGSAARPPVHGDRDLPYPEEQFGRAARVRGDRAQRARARRRRDQDRSRRQQPGEPIRFRAQLFGLSPGGHVLYFFQAPDPPAQRDAGRARRALPRPVAPRRHADQPDRHQRSRRRASDLRRPGSVDGRCARRQLNLNVGRLSCRGRREAAGDRCAREPFADVNVRIGERVYTTRADAYGNWSLSVAAAAGLERRRRWRRSTDSRVGGAWSESCQSNAVASACSTPGGPTIKVPADLTRRRDRPARARRSSTRTSRRCTRPTAPRCRSTATRRRARCSRSAATLVAVHGDRPGDRRRRPRPASSSPSSTARR